MALWLWSVRERDATVPYAALGPSSSRSVTVPSSSRRMSPSPAGSGLMGPRYLGRQNYYSSMASPTRSLTAPAHWRRHGDRAVRVGNRGARIISDLGGAGWNWGEDREWRAWTLSLPLLETAGRDLSMAVPPVASYHAGAVLLYVCSSCGGTVATVKVRSSLLACGWASEWAGPDGAASSTASRRFTLRSAWLVCILL